MKTVRDACTLAPNALSIKLSDQVEQLDSLIADEGDGEAFFARTFITQGMRDLVGEGLARLAGANSTAVFHLKQAMGGGKTHLLVSLGLLAKHPGLRERHFAGMSHLEGFGQAAVAAFNGRNTPEQYFWGEIAAQLGRGDLFRNFWSGGPKAPDERDWLRLFEGDQPILILLDEMPPYFHYLATQSVGTGTVADIATRAFANLLTAAGKKKNVAVVVSDLAAAYETGGRLITEALGLARQELGRQERSITPVDLAANEIYDILRKRLFVTLPDPAVIADVAEAFGRKLAEAGKSKTASREAEAIADEIAVTYPFHPQLKNLIALFKENEHFKQTRGLIELISRLLRSVWDRPSNDVFLIGPQYFDLSIPEVRDKLTEISGMRDVIAKDLWDAQQSAHAQIIDLNSGKEAAAQVGALLLTASLSTAVNAIKGLTREEIVECLVSPLREASECITALEELEKVAWYLHRTSEGRVWFDRQENLTKLLQSLATGAPPNQVDELIRDRIRAMFKPIRKTAYEDVLPLPRLEDVADRVRRGRVLLVVSPDSKIPPEEVTRFFESLSHKNNLLVLTGERTSMGSLESAARQVFAVQKADHRIPKGHAQREDLERRKEKYDLQFTGTVLAFFDRLFFPVHRPGQLPRLAPRHLEQREASKDFDGEAQIEKTLTSDPIKLHLDVATHFDTLRVKAEDALWPESQDDTRWKDAEDRAAEQPAMYWLPRGGLEQLRATACNKGLWEDLGNGYVTKRPRKKRTSVQVVAESLSGDEGKVRLRVNALNGGPTPRIHYAEESPVSDGSPKLTDGAVETNKLRVAFLAVDPSGQFETGDPVTWTHTLKLRCELDEARRTVALQVAPNRGQIRYTLDGSNPRDGQLYTGPVPIGDGEVMLLAFVSAEDLEGTDRFHFAAKGEDSWKPDPVKPARLVAPKGRKLDSRQATYAGLGEAKRLAIAFENVQIHVGTGNRVASITLGELRARPDVLEALLNKLLEIEGFDAQTAITLTFRKAHCASGHDLQAFADHLKLALKAGDVEQ
jgi:hypothetical protein